MSHSETLAGSEGEPRELLGSVQFHGKHYHRESDHTNTVLK